ncbi:putative NAD-dependent epimerase/dehydratase family protein [Sphingomonas sp. UYAg733]
MSVMNRGWPGASGEALLLPKPYLVFMGDEPNKAFAKTAFGLRDWSRGDCIGEVNCGSNALTLGLPLMSPAEARARGARSLVIGIANSGGVFQDNWSATVLEALRSGLDIVSGMHMRLGDVPEIAEAARRHGRQLIDIRHPPAQLPTGTGRKRAGQRLLTVGTDCALGKKYTALALARAFVARGIDATFRATGQTGILIAGSGLPLDSVVIDFAAGAAEILSPDAEAEHWDIIEGQGSLFHPAYAGVSLALLHGSQPDVFVVCHDPSRMHVLGNPDYALPSIEEVIDLTLTMGRRTNPGIRCGGIAFNTAHLNSKAAAALIDAEGARLNLPVADPIRGGVAFEALVSACLLAR